MASVKNDSKDTFTKERRKNFYGVQTILVFFYFLVVPFCQSPAWCLDYYNAQNYRHFGLFDCDTVAMDNDVRIRYSAFPTFSPMITILIDVVCMIAFILMTLVESSWRNKSKNEKKATGTLFIAVFISVIDLTRCYFRMKYPYFANLMRVVVLLTFQHRLR